MLVGVALALAQGRDVCQRSLDGDRTQLVQRLEAQAPFMRQIGVGSPLPDRRAVSRERRSARKAYKPRHHDSRLSQPTATAPHDTRVCVRAGRQKEPRDLYFYAMDACARASVSRGAWWAEGVEVSCVWVMLDMGRVRPIVRYNASAQWAVCAGLRRCRRVCGLCTPTVLVL